MQFNIGLVDNSSGQMKNSIEARNVRTEVNNIPGLFMILFELLYIICIVIVILLHFCVIYLLFLFTL